MLSLLGLSLTACQEDAQHDDTTDDEYLSMRSLRSSIGLELTSDDVRHEQFALGLSQLFKKQTIRGSFQDYLSDNKDETILLADFFFNKVSSRDLAFDDIVNSSSDEDVYPRLTCDFLDDYFATYPGIEGAIVDYYDTISVDLSQSQFDFEVFLVFDDVDDAPGFIAGEKTKDYSIEDVPVGNVLKISMGDYRFVSMGVNAEGDGFRRQFFDLFDCSSMVSFVNNKDFETSQAQQDEACLSVHPLEGLKVTNLDDLLNHFNYNCGYPEGVAPPGGDDGSGGDGPTDPRSDDCDRDAIRNYTETLVDVRSVGGKPILRDCDTWCHRRDKRCIFQVDVLIPTSSPSAAANEGFQVIGSIKKVFSTGERRLWKNWESDGLRDYPLPITEWLYLEGKHGDEWQYSWTGRHRNRGTEVEKKLGISLSSSVGFEKEGVKIGRENKGESTITVKHANEDCFLGNEIARYCNPLRERKRSGDLYFLLNEQKVY